MTELRHDLPKLPSRMRKLPLDARGYPVPWFVQWFKDGPDFRVIDQARFAACVKRRLCWLCGEPLGRFMAFVVGPMCAVNRTSSEPPSHRECAEFAVRACPFLARPDARRREANLPEDATSAAGIPIDRNPGVTLIWMTRTYRAYRVSDANLKAVNGGVLFEMGKPMEMLWYAEGREATGIEVKASIESGLPALEAIAQDEGPHALAGLRDRVATLRATLP